MEGCRKPFNIEDEYAKNEKLKREDIRLLREWARNEGKYPEVPDLYLFLFLHSCYYNFDEAKNTLKCYYEQRANCPEIFSNRYPKQPSLQPHLDVIADWTLKYSTPKGYKLFYTKIIDQDPGKFDVYMQSKIYFCLFDLWLTAVPNCEGFVLILDADGLSWGHLPKFGINPLRKIIAYVQEAFPIRLKEVHVININAILEKIFVLAKMFMKKELYNMTHLHSDFSTLYEYVPKAALPRDYGGNDITVQDMHNNMRRLLDENADYFEKEVPVEIKKQRGTFSFLSNVF